ncbi:hypothetical protein D7147_18340 [Micromonospora musae]|uniref:WXG100 family type VII secretion target n=1 Tax=Micromonospora musae TaxID=1894970 RepID=A0A3A9YJ97_9ACTN|nr:hypothetical protein [Micromonospora musae]RKN17922.1 hypothetical protein D7147_18340 [Micromonospora musae]RKN32907.1 hypothetical protein D7044_11785 [Micromonospora musae]
MSSFVEIKSSVADIIGIANRISASGQSLASTMTSKLDAVTAMESGHGTLPRGDEFVEEFLKTYHKSIEVPGGGAQPMNEAVKSSMPKLGEAMVQLGKYAADAMWSYTGTDDDNRDQINRAGGRS